MHDNNEITSSQAMCPFPPLAVAHLTSPESELLTIRTNAVKQANYYIDNYLENDSAETDRGSVIAIVGEYGTGKTHLANKLLHKIRRSQTRTIHPLNLDAPADSFLALYKERFIPQINRNQIKERIQEYLSDIVADELDKSKVTKEVATLLRKREVSPVDVIRDCGLSESIFLSKLHETLKEITKNNEFGTAFYLLLRPEFESSVWEWLQGSPPDDSLSDRGITQSLDSDPKVLEAIGVIAYLFGMQNHRFVLVIDEMEKILSSTALHKPTIAITQAFKKLIEVINSAQALMILCGLPDFIETLPRDAKQRISCIVKPTPLTVEETAQYIREAQKKAGGEPRLKPFTLPAVEYLTDISGGNARKTIRLCFHVYRMAIQKGTDVTEAMIRETARDQFELKTIEDVSSEIVRTIDLNGWLFEEHKPFEEKDQSCTVDYWIPVGESGDGCALIIARSILHQSEIDELSSRANALKSINTGKNISAILIINGYLAEIFSEDTNNIFERVVIFRNQDFCDDVDAALKGIIRRLEDASKEDALTLLSKRIGQLSRQLRTVQDGISLINDRMLNKNSIGFEIQNSIKDFYSQIGQCNNNNYTGLYLRRTELIIDKARSIIKAQKATINEALNANFSNEYTMLSSTFKHKSYPSRNRSNIGYNELANYYSKISLVEQNIEILFNKITEISLQFRNEFTNLKNEKLYIKEELYYLKDFCLSYRERVRRPLSTLNKFFKSNNQLSFSTDTIDNRSQTEFLLNLGEEVFSALEYDLDRLY